MCPERPVVPRPVDSLARDRSAARGQRDWETADRLRAEIERSGWKIIDDGMAYSLEPAHPSDEIEEGRIRYGSSAAVPSRLDEASQGVATVVLRATDRPDDLERAMKGIRAHGPDGTTVVIVADGPSAEQADALDAGLHGRVAPVSGHRVDVTWTSARLGAGAALVIGLRRAIGPVVVLLDTSVELTGDIVSPLVRALDEPQVAVAGAFGVRSLDMRHFDAAPTGEVHAIEGYCLAFRRTDGAARGPIDERFRFYRNLDLWWSLVLRDEGSDAKPRKALALDLPVQRHEHREWGEMAEAERTRLSKRNFYRIIDRFGRRLDLLGAD